MYVVVLNNILYDLYITMTGTIRMNSLAEYENIIHSNFINDHLGLDLTKFKTKTFENNIKVDLNGALLLDIEKLKQEIISVIEYVQKFYPHRDDRPLWYRINIIDQAINQYIGIGFLNLENDWLKFIIDYLSTDRAEQSGDTILAIFDIDFNWTVCFTLSQDDSMLKIEKYEK